MTVLRPPPVPQAGRVEVLLVTFATQSRRRRVSSSGATLSRAAALCPDVESALRVGVGARVHRGTDRVHAVHAVGG